MKPAIKKTGGIHVGTELSCSLDKANLYEKSGFVNKANLIKGKLLANIVGAKTIDLTFFSRCSVFNGQSGSFCTETTPGDGKLEYKITSAENYEGDIPFKILNSVEFSFDIKELFVLSAHRSRDPILAYRLPGKETRNGYSKRKFLVIGRWK